MKILVAPLNWGLGHASRCIPLIHRLLNEGHEVVIGGDGESLTLLRKHFPKLRYVYLASLHLRYSKGKRQVWAMMKAFPRLLAWSIKDYAMLKARLREEPFDQVISDNRFGFYNAHVECIYITHQLHIMLPKGWKWAEGIASHIHARIYARFNKVWIPDYEESDKCLAGDLSRIPSSFHHSPFTFQYIGPLSRFTNHSSAINNQRYDIVAVLSGLEPHRSILEREIVERYLGKEEKVLIVQGLINKPGLSVKHKNITMMPSMADDALATALLGANHIIARSGYSTIMDMAALGLLHKRSSVSHPQIELIPTPGQPEQEYLAKLLQ